MALKANEEAVGKLQQLLEQEARERGELQVGGVATATTSRREGITCVWHTHRRAIG